MKVSCIRVGPIQTNCYIVREEASGAIALIDPGDDAQEILKLLGGDTDKVTYLLLTHGHYDHTTAVPELKRVMPQAKVYIHQGDANGAGNHLFPLAGQIDDLLLYDEGDTLPFGALSIRVLHTPGHSPGSVTLMVGDVLFTGDTMFAGECGRCDLPGGSYPQILQSLKRLALLEGDYQVCPGHEGFSTLERERHQNPYVREAMKL